MADPVDLCQQEQSVIEESRIREIQRQAASIPPGNPGDCKGCGEYKIRLVNEHCGACRDRLKLP